MRREPYLYALAGLLSHPIIWERVDAIVPSQWLAEVKSTKPATIAFASKVAAGQPHMPETIAGKPGELTSIFYQLKLPGNKGCEKKLTWPVRELGLRVAPFDTSDSAKPESLLDEFFKKAEVLRATFSEAKPEQLPAFVENLLALLQRYTWCLSCGISALDDVSLYDQSRMTAALATLWEDSVPTGSDDCALLVGGDFSGIQDFIYTITDKGAAKTLRGRSFYLQLLTETILRFTLGKLDLPYTNVIYAGGGHFFLLAPVEKAKELPAIQTEITRKLFKHHGVSLYLALGSAFVTTNGFSGGKFPEYWGQMHKALSGQKQRRYSELGPELYKTVFEPHRYGGNLDTTCAVCGGDLRKVELLDPEDQNSDDKICRLCKSFEKMGKSLPDAQFLALGLNQAISRSIDDAFDVLAEFGVTCQFVDEPQKAISMNSDRVVIWALDDPENDVWPTANGTTSIHTLRYTANKRSVNTFDELEDQVDGGFKRIGVLRMDVDNLGDLFKHGLGERATLTRLAGLSFNISFFFEGWLKRLCEQDQRVGLIYTVYSGGDDLFLLGPWDIMSELAQDIVQDFAKYTGQNPSVHASAGLAFIHNKYPIYQAAEDAKDAIDQAKAVEGKNAFSFLGNAWPWPIFADVQDKQTRLENLVKQNGDHQVDRREERPKEGPRSILQVLHQLALDEAQYGLVNGKHVWGRWIWMGMYQLTRMMEQNEGLSGEIQGIRDSLEEKQYIEIDQWGAAARWTELKIRKKQEEKR